MAVVKVSDKGQVVIPAEMRRRLGIVPGSELEFTEEGTTIRVSIKRLKKQTRVEDGYGMLVHRGAPRKLADFDVAEVMKKRRLK